MKNLLLIIIHIYNGSFAQEALVAQDTLYLNINYGITTKQQAEYIRIIYGEDSNYNGFIFEEFDSNGKLEKSGVITKKTGRPNGLIISYHQNGIKKNEGRIEETRKGIWKEWYQNGEFKSEIDHVSNDKGQTVAKMINYNDSLGNSLVKNGNGMYKLFYRNDVNGQIKETGQYKDHFCYGKWEGYYKNGLPHFIENYTEGGKFKNGISYDSLGNSYKYKELGVSPSPKNGYEGFYKTLGQSIIYPKTAVEQGVEGKVFVQFTVDKNGELIDVKTVKGISKECNEEAERVIMQSERWNPGIQKGQPVKVKMIVPITFKL